MEVLLRSIVYVFVFCILCFSYGLCLHSSGAHNFSLGGLFGFGFLLVWISARLFGYSPFYAMIPCVLVGGVLNMGVYKVVYAGLEVKDEFKVLALIGVEIIYLGLTQILAFVIRELPRFRTIDFGFIVGEFDEIVFGIPASLWVSVITLIITVTGFTRSPRYRTTLKAVNESPNLAAIQGVNLERIRVVSWFVAGGLACLCGGIIGFWVMGSPSTGDLMIPSIIAGSMLGGLGNIPSMMIGGGIIGLLRGLVFWVAIRFEIPVILEFLGILPITVIAVTMWSEPGGLHRWSVKRKRIT